MFAVDTCSWATWWHWETVLMDLGPNPGAKIPCKVSLIKVQAISPPSTLVQQQHEAMTQSARTATAMMSVDDMTM
jgi:hypothetical protein